MTLGVKTKKIAIIGGPASGKTSIIDQLLNKGHVCMEEISRQITLAARQQQFIDAGAVNRPFVFFDRGLPDVIA